MGALYFDQMPETPVAYDPPSWTPTSFEADWSSCCGTLGYILDVAFDPEFSNYVPGYENLPLNDTNSWYDVTGLENGHYYYYRVKAQNSACSSDYSNCVTVSYLTSINEKDVLPFTLYSSGSTVYLQASEKIDRNSFVQIFNSAGQLIASKPLQSGMNCIALETGSQVMVLRVVLNGKAYCKKLLIK